MSRFVLAALFVAASAPLAHADTYVGLGLGTAASGSSELLGTVDGYSRSGRLMVGTRISRVSLEGQASRFNLATSAFQFEATQLAAGLKLSIPLGNNFEAFARGGLTQTWLNALSGYDADGGGWFLGGGFEYRLNLGLTGASIFVDYQHSSMTVTNERMTEYGLSVGMWTLGATVSI